MKNEINLRFCIWGFEDISHQEISIAIGLNPTKIYIKGERKNPKYPALAKENGWLYQASENIHSSFEDQMEILLKIFENKKEIIAWLSKSYFCEISCGVFIYYDNEESLPSIHLDSRHFKILNEFQMAFDVDIYCLPIE